MRDAKMQKEGKKAKSRNEKGIITNSLLMPTISSIKHTGGDSLNGEFFFLLIMSDAMSNEQCEKLKTSLKFRDMKIHANYSTKLFYSKTCNFNA